MEKGKEEVEGKIIGEELNLLSLFIYP